MPTKRYTRGERATIWLAQPGNPEKLLAAFILAVVIYIFVRYY